MSLVVNLIGQRSRDVIGRLSVSRDVTACEDCKNVWCVSKRAGCGNVSQSHHKQSFSGLHSPG